MWLPCAHSTLSMEKHNGHNMPSAVVKNASVRQGEGSWRPHSNRSSKGPWFVSGPIYTSSLIMMFTVKKGMCMFREGCLREQQEWTGGWSFTFLPNTSSISRQRDPLRCSDTPIGCMNSGHEGQEGVRRRKLLPLSYQVTNDTAPYLVEKVMRVRLGEVVVQLSCSCS